MQTTKPFPADGAPLVADARSYRIQLTPTIDGGYVLRILAGTNCEWMEDFTGERTARQTARAITVALRGGISVHQVVQDRRNAANVVADAERFIRDAYAAVDADQVAADINAEWDERHVETTATHDELVADVQAIVGDRQGWNSFRQQAAQTVAARTSDPMVRILRAAALTDGSIQRGGRDGQATSTQLVALANRGLITLTRTGGKRRRIVGGKLTAKGFKYAGVTAPLAA